MLRNLHVSQTITSDLMTPSKQIRSNIYENNFGSNILFGQRTIIERKHVGVTTFEEKKCITNRNMGNVGLLLKFNQMFSLCRNYFKIQMF